MTNPTVTLCGWSCSFVLPILLCRRSSHKNAKFGLLRLCLNREATLAELNRDAIRRWVEEASAVVASGGFGNSNIEKPGVTDNNNTIEGGCVKTVASKTGHQWFGSSPAAGPDHPHWWASWRDFCTSAKSVGTATVSPPATPNSPPMPMLLHQPTALHHHAPHEEQPLDFSVGTMSKYKEPPVQKMLQQNGAHHITRHYRNNNKQTRTRSYRQQQQQHQDTSSSSSEDEGVGPPSPSAVESPGPLRGDGEFNTHSRVSACTLQWRVIFVSFFWGGGGFPEDQIA